VPSVLVPHNADQFTWARRLAELGVSPPPIPRRKLSAERLGPAIIGATTSRVMRQRAATLARRIRAEDGVARAVEVFEGRFGAAARRAPTRRPRTSAVADNVQ
jgi:UDP:flavonoid glycosyltransferase YjiC (YdhE family)